MFHLYVAIVAGDIVDTGQNHHVFGLQLDYVGTEAGEHMHSGLPTYAAANEIMGVEPFSVAAHPVTGN